jgi:hypothetical protein
MSKQSDDTGPYVEETEEEGEKLEVDEKVQSNACHVIG